MNQLNGCLATRVYLYICLIDFDYRRTNIIYMAILLTMGRGENFPFN